MTHEQLEGAIELIRQRVACDRDTAEYVARQMYDLWTRQRDWSDILNVPPGEIARRFRKRYESTPMPRPEED